MNQLKPFREILGPTKAGKTGTLRAEWTSGDHTTEKFFDYVLKKGDQGKVDNESTQIG